MAKTSEAQIRAVRNYENKTYKRYTINLRLEEDNEIINSIEEAKAKGINLREWIINLFEGQKWPLNYNLTHVI